MPDLVAEAGISAGAFYRYFGGKDELIRKIARESFAGIGSVGWSGWRPRQSLM
jgi:TetR/AcrR family transcriptional regulator, transcriptional repressor of aconitase